MQTTKSCLVSDNCCSKVALKIDTVKDRGVRRGVSEPLESLPLLSGYAPDKPQETSLSLARNSKNNCAACFDSMHRNGLWRIPRALWDSTKNCLGHQEQGNNLCF